MLAFHAQVNSKLHARVTCAEEKRRILTREPVHHRGMQQGLKRERTKAPQAIAARCISLEIINSTRAGLCLKRYALREGVQTLLQDPPLDPLYPQDQFGYAAPDRPDSIS